MSIDIDRKNKRKQKFSCIERVLWLCVVRKVERFDCPHSKDTAERREEWRH